MNTNKIDQEYLVQQIRTQYTEKEHTELDALKALDKKVRTPAKVFGCTFGTLAALILGWGMSLVMTDIGGAVGLTSPLVPGIVTGITGLVMAAANWPIYRRILTSRRKKYAAQVISLSDQIIKG